MSEIRDPKIGDVWRLRGKPPSEGLIIGTQGTGFRIIGRSRQETCVSMLSFKTTWDFVYSKVKHPCCVCQEDGWLTDWLDAKPYCEKHIPKHQPIWLNADKTEIERPHPFLCEVFEHCRLCSVPSTVRRMEWSPKDGWIVGTCECRTKTIPIFVNTSVGDNGTFSIGVLIEDTKKAIEYLKNHGTPNIRIVCGPYQSGTVLDQLLKSLSNAMNFSIDDEAKIGPNNILVVGTPNLSNEEAAVLYQHVDLCSFWKERKEGQLFQITRESPSTSTVLIRSVEYPNTTVTAHKKTSVTTFFTRVPNTFTENPSKLDALSNGYKNPHLKVLPKVADRWFNTDLGCITTVTEILEDTVTFEVIDSHRSPTVYSTTIEEFQLEHDPEQVEFREWKIGEEYEYGPFGSGVESGILTSINDTSVSVEDPQTKQMSVISIAHFFGARRLIRKSLLERLFDSPFDD